SGSLKRFAGYLGAERIRVVVITVLAVVSVGLTVMGPKLLGTATNLIFEGFVSRGLPAGATKAEVVSGLRADGQDQLADMLSGMTLTSGGGLDFDALRDVLLLVVAVYVGASLFGWLQGRFTAIVVQNTVLRLRDQVEEKINRLPLGYFDKQKS